MKNHLCILRCAAALVLLALGACGGGGDGGGGEPPAAARSVIGAAGGTLSGSNGVAVVVPPGALAGDTTIGIEQTSAGAPALPVGFVALGKTFAFTPHGLTFAVPVTLTIPFDPALLSAGAVPVLYKTNAAQLAFEPVVGATVNGVTMTAQVSGFSHLTVRDEKNGVLRNDPVRSWNIARLNGSLLDPLESGTQTGGDVLKQATFAASDPAFELDSGASPGILRGEVFSNADGSTYWAYAEGPGAAHLTQSQSFIKRTPGATLQVIVTDSYLRAIDGNQNPSLAECPRVTAGMTQAQIHSVCHPITAQILFRVKAFKGTGESPSPLTSPGSLFFNIGSVASLSGFIGNWKFGTARAAFANADVFNTGNFIQGDPNSLLQTATLNGRLVFDVDLSSVEVCPAELKADACKDKAFTLESILNVTAFNLRGRESGVAAFLRDPLKTTGGALQMSGLEATNAPAAAPPLTVEVPRACPTGPNANAGVLQFGQAAYTLLEDPVSELAITVTRTQGSQGAVSVTFRAVDGTAVSGVDYEAPSVTVHFADGDVGPQVVALTVLLDDLAEDDKTVNLQLSEPGGCATLGPQANAVVTLVDDDRPPPPPPPSGLDTSFDADGKATTTAFGGDRSAMALQADGKIVMVGGTFVDFVLARFNADGSIDTGFGIDGKVTTDMGSGLRTEEALGVAIQPDGKIVVVGYTAIPNAPPAPALPPTFAIARYNSDGSIDTGFGTGGRVSGNVNGLARAVAIQPDGKIVLAGDVSFPSTNNVNVSDFTVARFNANGSLDLAFGSSGTGQVATDIGGATNIGSNLVLQPNGAIVVSGHTAASSVEPDHTDIVRYNANGTLDPSFGSGGKLTLAGVLAGEGLVRQGDGRFVLAGNVTVATVPATARFLLMRLNVDGSPDAGFGNAGRVDTAFTDNAGARAVALQGDGKIVAVGTRAFSPNPNFIVARYNADGSLDTGFGGGDGNLSIDFFGFDDIGENVLVQPDGKIVVGGQARNNVDGYGVARINP